MTTKKAPAKAKGPSLPANIKEELRKQAARQAGAASVPTGRSVKPTHQGFKFPDGRIAESPMKCVVIDVVSRNAYYNTPYVAGQVKPAACAAHGFKKNDDLIPLEGCSEQQAVACGVCPMNEFGSALGGTGPGKACQNRKLMAILPPDATKDEPLMTMDASPTSIGSVDAFVHQLASQDMPTVAATVEIHIKVNPNSNAVSIELRNPGHNDNLVNMYERVEEARRMLEAMTPNIGKQESASPQKALPRKKAVRKKKVATRRH